MRTQRDKGIFWEMIPAIGAALIIFILFCLGKRWMDQSVKGMLSGILGKIAEQEPDIVMDLAVAFVGRSTTGQQILGKEVLKKAGIGEVGFQHLGKQYGSQWYALLYVAVIIVILIYTLIEIREKRQNLSDLTHLSEDIRFHAQSGVETAEWGKMHSAGMAAVRDACSEAFRIMRIRCVELEKERENLRRYFEDISHQMKTPMTNISLIQEILLEEEEDRERRELLIRCGKKIEEVQELLISIPHMIRLDIFVTKMNLSRHSVGETLNHALRSVELLAKDKKILLKKKGEDAVQAVYDEFWVSEALKNLLKNAIEHSPEGGTVTIEFSTDSCWHTLSVLNQGETIPESMKEKVFQRYVSGFKDPIRGTGIGLNIAWQVARYHGGSLDVIPRKDGTCIRFRIPDNSGKKKYKEKNKPS